MPSTIRPKFQNLDCEWKTLFTTIYHPDARMILTMSTIGERIRKLLAKNLSVQQESLHDEFRWVDIIGVEDAEYFLADVNNAFDSVPSGFSVGDGERLFGHVNAKVLEQIGTVGGLVRYAEEHLQASITPCEERDRLIAEKDTAFADWYERRNEFERLLAERSERVSEARALAEKAEQTVAHLQRALTTHYVKHRCNLSR